ncbi:hypothetical protein [Nonomuraea africana]|uniref:Uncharacterized protein n=1 Tax=Nonomuraea africana TaxID=46171 RepID=A0ABR9KDC1_9ACTN|nr:hypothetical protein [Nonomuraea africana]MBE1559996.1 hypothetical protein [Nonomuraea africana]
MIRDFPARVRELVAELQSVPDLVMDSCHIGQGAARELTAEDADVIRSAMGDGAVEDVRGYLLGTDHIQVAWHLDDHSVYGEFHLKDLRNCLAGGYLPYADARLSPVEQRVMGEELKTLEEAPGSGRLTALRLRLEAECRELWFYDTNHRRLALLDLDYPSYLENLLITKGIPGWQYLFTDTDIRHREFHAIVRQLERSLDSFPDLFPHHDYSDLRERLEARL